MLEMVICICEQEFLTVNLWSQTVLNFHRLIYKGLSLENLGHGKAEIIKAISLQESWLWGEREKKNKGMPTNAYFLFFIFTIQIKSIFLS